MDDKNVSASRQVITSLAAGAFAGAVAKTTIAPLDRCKINFQVRQWRYTFTGAFKFLVQTYKKEGFTSLWRGNTATLARIIPSAAIQYASHEQWRNLLVLFTGSNSIRELPSHWRFVAGSLAGVTASTCTYPLDLARARMAVTPKDRYANIFQVFMNILREEGVSSLYRGYSASVLGVIPYAGVSFGTYESLKWFHQDPLTPLHRLGFGALAGLLGQTSSYPLDIARRRMQTSEALGGNQHYKTILTTFVYVYRTEGLRRGLYKGLSMNWIKGPIGVGISFTIFDTVQYILRWAWPLE
ncbi:DgyrCDS923 [Dimorphilus gyrociliatus]|uniref:DgyrCDS923 n=1 Tax=Dimorphilus gyrociliatus TaxID=2664684 RepID=A0A7I8V795_9ANNE|nr:DgyrCDS923 [Dimorphilus gyrociliatus]